MINRKVKRDEFPFQTYVFVADQLNLPTGLTTATLTGQLKTGQSFVTQKEVLNIPDSARAFGVLKQKMGNISIYKALAKFEARNPGSVISASSSTVTLASRNSHAHGIAKVAVNYTPALALTGATPAMPLRKYGSARSSQSTGPPATQSTPGFRCG